jgi:hypothetical protein
MKNTFLLPTDKPSRLAFDTDENFYLLCEEPVFFKHQELVENRSIYITSDEEIKVGDHILDIVNGEVMISKGKMLNNPYVKKIILTTDQKLIADGIQDIDDEFLEWFVKNPTCEYAHIGFIAHNDIREYKIIIPQEEPKQDETGKYFADNADVIITMERPKQVKYTEDEVRELLIKGLTHNDDKLCGSLVTVEKEIRTANFNVWFEENKKK